MESAPIRKRGRGSYAKLICLRCRERRIKCKLDDDGTIVPSSEPQPPEKACMRCRQQGLQCVVRKTTLGRPNLKPQPPIPSPASTIPVGSRSPSPDPEELVLLNLEDDEGSTSRRSQRAASIGQAPAGDHIYAVINRSFDLVSSLLARDRRYGSGVAALKAGQPKLLEHILTADIARWLDKSLVWHQLYMPWMPHLGGLWYEVVNAPKGSARFLSASALFALLASIALDVPSELNAPYRHIQPDLNCIAHAYSQELIFMMPRDEYFLTILELTHNHRPLLPIDGHQAAAYTLSGNLYATLCRSLQARLGLDGATKTLSILMRTGQDQNISIREIERLVLSVLRWCSTAVWRIGLDLEEVEIREPDNYELTVELNNALDVASEAIQRFKLERCFFPYHIFRYHGDDMISLRHMTRDWRDLAKLTEHVDHHISLRARRKVEFKACMAKIFSPNNGNGNGNDKSFTEEGRVISHLLTLELGQGFANVVGVGMFYAIMSDSHHTLQTQQSHDQAANESLKSRLTRMYTARIEAEAPSFYHESKTGVAQFLHKYGDTHIDGLEKRLSDFINAASEISLHGIPWVGRPRHAGTNVLSACREIVENNAVRLKLDKCLHPRVDTQLVLFENAARRLEGMEVEGGTLEAIVRGSVLTACAKLIRSLWKMLWEWKRRHPVGRFRRDGETAPVDEGWDGVGGGDVGVLTAEMMQGDAFMIDDWFEENGFATLDPAEMATLFPYDLDVAGL